MKTPFSGYEKTKNVIDMLAATQVKMSGSEKEKKRKAKRSTHDICSLKRVTWAPSTGRYPDILKYM